MDLFIQESSAHYFLEMWSAGNRRTNSNFEIRYSKIHMAVLSQNFSYIYFSHVPLLLLIFQEIKCRRKQHSKLIMETELTFRTWVFSINSLKMLFIYLWETGRDTQAEGEAGSMQGARCRTLSQDPGFMPWAKGRCSTTEPPRRPSSDTYLYSIDVSISQG